MEGEIFISIWGAIKRAVNSRLDVPLDFTLGQRDDGVSTVVNNTTGVIGYLKGILTRANSVSAQVDAIRNQQAGVIGGGAIRSLQRITTVAGAEAAVISPVNVDRAVLFVAGGAGGGATHLANWRVNFVGNGQVAVSAVGVSGMASAPSFVVFVVEYW